jgi:hypothetical protein
MMKEVIPMTCYLTPAESGVVVFDILRNDFHRPFVNGKCNRENIEEQITLGILSGYLSPMTQTDVDFVCDLVDDLIMEYGNGGNSVAKGA